MAKIESATLEELVDDDLDEIIEKMVKLNDNDIEQRYTNLSFRVIYQTNNYFLPQVSELIRNREVINIRPEYQRRLRWSHKQKSLLIESLLLNIPIPPVFFYESDLARYEVMDGQQRLNAIHDYLENAYPLFGLEKLGFLNRRTYKELPPKVRRGLERASISAIILLKETKSDDFDPYIVRRYVFERLNTGGKPLNAQEIRNSLYRGKFNDLINFLARNDTFCEIFGIPQYREVDENAYYENPERQRNNLYRTMGDSQIVLRFFALLDDEKIRGSMKRILDDCMRRCTDPSDEDLGRFRADFETGITTAKQIFGEQVFLLPADEKGNRRISIALYDSIMVSLIRRRDRIPMFLARRQEIVDGVNRMLSDREQLALLTGKANTAQSIKDRINAIGKIFDGLP